jgi:large conductance mechanosensitive channel
MGMMSEFKEFINKGSVLDLAVGVIIGGAFGKIVGSLTDDIIMPIIGYVTGGVDFSSKFILLGPVPDKYAGSLTDYAALKKAGAAMIGYGAFVTAVITFLILAFVIFQIVKAANRAMPAKPAAPTGPSETDLLIEIRIAVPALFFSPQTPISVPAGFDRLW